MWVQSATYTPISSSFQRFSFNRLTALSANEPDPVVSRSCQIRAIFTTRDCIPRQAIQEDSNVRNLDRDLPINENENPKPLIYLPGQCEQFPCGIRASCNHETILNWMTHDFWDNRSNIPYFCSMIWDLVSPCFFRFEDQLTSDTNILVMASFFQHFSLCQFRCFENKRTNKQTILLQQCVEWFGERVALVAYNHPFLAVCTTHTITGVYCLTGVYMLPTTCLTRTKKIMKNPLMANRGWCSIAFQRSLKLSSKSNELYWFPPFDWLFV